MSWAKGNGSLGLEVLEAMSRTFWRAWAKVTGGLEFGGGVLPIQALGGPRTSLAEPAGNGGPLSAETAGREAAACQVVTDEIIAEGDAATRGVDP